MAKRWINIDGLVVKTKLYEKSKVEMPCFLCEWKM